MYDTSDPSLFKGTSTLLFWVMSDRVNVVMYKMVVIV